MLLILVLYNFIALALLFAPSNSIKLKLWNLTPYDYAHIMGFPNNLNKKSLLNEFNRLSNYNDNKYEFIQPMRLNIIKNKNKGE